MKSVINEARLLNEHIKNTEEYKKYISARQNLMANEELYNKFKEFRYKNHELQSREGQNPYDEVSALVLEYDDLLHNSVVSAFIRAERKICRKMQRMYEELAEGLEFDFFNE